MFSRVVFVQHRFFFCNRIFFHFFHHYGGFNYYFKIKLNYILKLNERFDLFRYDPRNFKCKKKMIKKFKKT